ERRRHAGVGSGEVAAQPQQSTGVSSVSLVSLRALRAGRAGGALWTSRALKAGLRLGAQILQPQRVVLDALPRQRPRLHLRRGRGGVPLCSPLVLLSRTETLS